jgi:flagellar basal-body rod protein FlgB
MQLFGTLTQGLGRALDLYQARHTVLAENIANSETPGYRARDVEFRDVLQTALQPPDPETPGHPETLDSGPIHVEPTLDRGATIKPDGNSVALDVQVGRMSENAFKIQALTQILAARYEGLKRVIDGGK